ncbi:hypothetical protein [Oceanicoccus sp. KOV_DT_Chl]|uniref:hypothetical protein n=1 Tax=Oceanicoccus sp. KOV_DT_Chl TaxID=1904639 RepID=UPI0011AFA8F1|nr:hypothetical protein [Oceanicoccus sp. KOV_DT_Chl]
MYRIRVMRACSLLICLFIVQGCVLNGDENPHNDVLVFGTTTKFALDVSAPIQNGGIPEFTLGYKRLEAVWMPLKPNGKVDYNPDDDVSKLITNIKKCDDSLKDTITDQKQRASFCLTAVLPAGKYVSLSSGIEETKGGNELEIDTYSVFASLGAKGTLGFNSASGNLAQFFATGVAAQRLGANQSVGMALNAEAPEAQGKKAEAEQEKSKADQEKSKEVQALLDAGATPEEATTLANGTKDQISSLNKEIIEAKGCVFAWKGTTPANLIDAEAKRISGYHNNEKRLVSDLKKDDAARAEILKACRA